MDDHRFDQITRALGGKSGRRQAVKSIFGGAAAALGVAGLAEAQAKNKSKNQGAQGGGPQCRGEGHPCVGQGNVCCEGLICGSAPNPGADVRCCTPGADCQPACGKNAACGDGEVCCNGSCVSGVCCNTGDCNNSKSQGKNKGKSAKGKSAKGKRGLEGGAEHCCDNQCVDTDNDPNNCGRCGNVCDQDQTCVNGKCTSQTQCSDQNPCTGDQTCCGGTCVTCPTGGICSGTTCVCPEGQIDCDGTCVLGVCCTSDDCPTGDTCNGDHQCVSPVTCDPPCTGSDTCCSGACVDTQTDPNNCGDCGTVCPGGDTCVAGQCTAGGGCTSDQDCTAQPGGLCLIDGTCFYPSTCPAGETNLACCVNAVKKACRKQGGKPKGGGGKCRRQGKKRCKKNFGAA